MLSPQMDTVYLDFRKAFAPHTELSPIPNYYRNWNALESFLNGFAPTYLATSIHPVFSSTRAYLVLFCF